MYRSNKPRPLNEEVKRRIELTKGYLRLYHPYELEVVLALVDLGQAECNAPIPVRGLLSSKKSFLQIFRGIVYCSSNSIAVPSICSINYHLCRILTCYQDSMPSVKSQLQLLLEKFTEEKASSDFFKSLYYLEVHRHCIDVFLSSIFEKLLPPLLEALIGWNDTSEVYGKALVYISLLRLQLLCPTSVFDPATEDGIKHDLLNQKLHEQSHFLLMFKKTHSLAGHPFVDAPMHYLITETRDMMEEVEALRDRTVRRPSKAPPFSDLFFELRDVCEQIVSVEVVTSIIQKASKLESSCFVDEDVEGEEMTLQNSLHAVIGRLSSFYLHYEDIASPVCSALHGISMGLRLFVGSVVSKANYVKLSDTYKSSVSLEGSWKSLLCFPLFNGYNLNNREEIIVSSKNSLLNTQHSMNVIRLMNKFSNQAQDRILESMLLLSIVDRITGSEIVSAEDFHDEVRSILRNLSAHVVTVEEEKSKREAMKNAAYQYRTQTAEFMAESEEDSAFRANFPDHTVELERLHAQDDAIPTVLPNDVELTDEFYCDVVGCYNRLVLSISNKKAPQQRSADYSSDLTVR